MSEIDVKKLFVLDESGFSLNMIKAYGRCEKSKRLKMPAPLHGKNISAIGVINFSRVVDIALIEGSTNQSCIEIFIEKSILPHLKRGDILLIDNAPVHNLERINEKLLKPIGAFILPLPRYSPEFSPIEMLWSKVKEYIRKLKPRTTTELLKGFSDAIWEVDEEDLSGWYEHCGYNI